MKALSIVAPSDARVVEIAEPPAPQQDEVLLRVERVGLCGSDLNTYLGKNPMVSYPRVLGHEVAGTIVLAGSAVGERWQPGVNVTFTPYTACGVCPSCRAGRHNACRDNKTMGVQRDGALTELVTVPAAKLHTSQKLSLLELALVEPFSVGFHAAARARVEPDDTVLVIGCGGVGLGAVAGAVSRGARVIALDSQEEKLSSAKSLGASHALLSGADTRDQIMQLTDGDGPAVVIEAVGAVATYRAAVEWVRFCGRVVYIGYGKEPVPYETKLFVQKELDIMGARNCLGEFADVISFFERRTFDPNILVSQAIDISEAPDALANWAARPGQTSKIMVRLTH